MFDIGATELIVVAVLALVVVGPKELPRLLRTVGGIVRKMRELAAEFKDGIEQLANEAETQVDPFAALRKEGGLRPGMSPEDITSHIMKNREREAKDEAKSESGGETRDKDASDKGAGGKDA
jgi:sec-independent protein translocase protein TatB